MEITKDAYTAQLMAVAVGSVDKPMDTLAKRLGIGVEAGPESKKNHLISRPWAAAIYGKVLSRAVGTFTVEPAAGS